MQFDGLLFLIPFLFSLDLKKKKKKMCRFFFDILTEYTSKKLTVFTESRSESDFLHDRVTELQHNSYIGAGSK